ncbi:hypothetical protein CEXT_436491 [Caerostris extrusa]|uniref:Uncharacterized protein n=1 Tax=Caerostris extrusa TaxID=172846 RepID=A0AAV4M685_CAEEX|nr:hypothetical protein CEXT_436491 [Caerostris extrusa]
MSKKTLNQDNNSRSISISSLLLVQEPSDPMRYYGVKQFYGIHESYFMELREAVRRSSKKKIAQLKKTTIKYHAFLRKTIFFWKTCSKLNFSKENYLFE